MKNKLKRINKDSFLVALIHRYSSTFFLQLSGLIVGMLVAKLLGPEMLGIWGIFQLIISYYSYTNLGATNGLSRNLGIAIGNKDDKAIHDTIGAANISETVLTKSVLLLLLLMLLLL